MQENCRVRCPSKTCQVQGTAKIGRPFWSTISVTVIPPSLRPSQGISSAINTYKTKYTKLQFSVKPRASWPNPNRNGSCDYKVDVPMGLGRKPWASQKIAISSSAGTGNRLVRGAIDIYHIALHFWPKSSQWCICPLIYVNDLGHSSRQLNLHIWGFSWADKCLNTMKRAVFSNLSWLLILKTTRKNYMYCFLVFFNNYLNQHNQLKRRLFICDNVIDKPLFFLVRIRVC